MLLSFIFTSCAQVEKSNIARWPAEVDLTCAQLLMPFYKNQNLERMESRISATKLDPHKFYRSFPPLYFKILEDLKLENEFGNILRHKGVIGGDVHVENFGIRTYKGTYKLLINDFDDLSEGPLFYDVIRLLSSMKLSGFKVDKDFIKKFILNYQQGLEGKKENYSKVTMKFFQDAKKAKRIDKNKVSKRDKLFLKKREPSFEISPLELEAWKDLMINEGKIVDSYKYVKESGGSGGLDRYELLVETSEGKLYWLEAKEWELPGINAGLNTKPPSYKKRLEYVQAYDQPEFVSITKRYDNKTFFIREINDSHIGVTIDGLAKKDMEEMYLDEAFALGAFHRNLNPITNYQEDLKNIKSSSISTIVKSVYNEMIELVNRK